MQTATEPQKWENTKGKHTRKLRHIPPLAGGAKRPHPNAKHQDCCLLGMKLRSEKVRRVFYLPGGFPTTTVSPEKVRR